MKHARLTVLSGILFVTATHFSLGDEPATITDLEAITAPPAKLKEPAFHSKYIMSDRRRNRPSAERLQFGRTTRAGHRRIATTSDAADALFCFNAWELCS